MLKAALSILFLLCATACLPHFDRADLALQASSELQNSILFLESEFEAAKFSADQQSTTVIAVPATVLMYDLSVKPTDLGVTDKSVSVRDFLDRTAALTKSLLGQDFEAISPQEFQRLSQEAVKLQVLGYALAQSKNREDVPGHPFNNASLHYLNHMLANALGKAKCIMEQASFLRWDGTMVAIGCEIQSALSTLADAPGIVTKVLEKGAIPSGRFFQTFDEISAHLQNMIETAQAQKEYRLARRVEKLQSNVEFLRRAVAQIHSTTLEAKDQMYRVLGSQVETQARALLATINPYLSTGKPIEAKPQDFEPLKTSLIGLAAMIGKRKSTNPFSDSCKSSNAYDCLAAGLRTKPDDAMKLSKNIENTIRDLTTQTDGLCPVSPLCNQGKKLRDQSLAISMNMLALQNNIAGMSANLQTISNIMKSEVATGEALLRGVR